MWRGPNSHTQKTILLWILNVVATEMLLQATPLKPSEPNSASLGAGVLTFFEFAFYQNLLKHSTYFDNAGILSIFEIFICSKNAFIGSTHLLLLIVTTTWRTPVLEQIQSNLEDPLRVEWLINWINVLEEDEDDAKWRRLHSNAALTQKLLGNMLCDSKFNLKAA